MGGGELSYLILTIFASQSWEEGGGAPGLGGGGDFQDSLCVCVSISINAEHCKLTTLRFESKRRVVNLQCSALIEMGVVVVKWSEFCYVGYVRHSCIKITNALVL